jgi:SAM-dependent MidA family methyltransferase
MSAAGSLAAPAAPGRLERRIAALIRATGPIDVATFMTLALADPIDGYYSAHARLGGDGDFVTSPEVSQLFGELVGIALAATWQAAGSPPAQLVELGPGNGTLMADLWRATSGVPGFQAAMAVHLVEASRPLRDRQAATLAALPGCRWHDDLATVPHDRPLLVVANEFFDALPIRQCIREAGRWHDVRVDLDGAGRLCLGRSEAPSPLGPVFERALPAADLADGSVVEWSPAREAMMAALAGRLRAQGGYALVIDYGEREPTPGSSLQAVSRHRKVDPLTRPGEVDLTSRVAFAPILQIAREAGLRAFGPIPQGLFLDRLGAAARLARLGRNASPAVAERLAAGHRRLTDPTMMGALFKVLAVGSWRGIPPGFLAEEAA